MIPGVGSLCWREGIGYPLQYSWASLVARTVKNLPAMWETWVRSLGWDDHLEKGTATNSVLWPGQRSLAGYSPWGRKESEMTERLHFLLSFYYVLVTEPRAIQAIPHSIPTTTQGGGEHYSSCLCVRDGKNQSLEGLLICVKSE